LFQAVVNWLIKLKELPNDKVEGYCELGEFVSAAADDMKYRIAFKKQLVQYLLDRERGDEASAKIEELRELEVDVGGIAEDVSQQLPSPVTAEKLNNEAHFGIKNPDLTPSYLNGGKGLPIMNNKIDRNFYTMMQSIKNCGSVEALASAIVQNFHKLPGDKKNWYVARLGKNRELELLPIVQPRAKSLYNHADDIIWLYKRLANYRSRYALFAFVHNWAFWGDLLGRVGKIRDDIYKEYLDFDVLSFGVNEVYADCGGYNGDSLADYLNEVGADSYKKIYVYEFDPPNCEAIEKMLNTNGLRNIVLRKKAVGLNGKLRYTPVAPEADHSSNSLSDIGEVEVDVVSLDDDINEPLTYIKMDIEGSEYAAILGAKRHIVDEYPKLAICLYHKPNDIWELPRLIDAIAPNYKFYLTFCGFAMDTVGFAMLAVKGETKPVPDNQIQCTEIIGVNERGEFMKRAIKEVQPGAAYAAPVSTTTKQQIVIAGVNQYAQKLKQMLTQENGGYTLTHFFDETDTNTGKTLDDVVIIGIEQLKKLYDSGNIRRVIVAYSGFSYPYNKTYEILHEAGINDKVYVVPVDWYSKQDCRLEDALVQADMARGAIDFMEIDVCPHCNFACRGCAALAPKMEPEFMTVAEFEKALKLLSDKFWHISRFRISGGETLLHPNCADFVRLTRQYYPTAELAVQSNGLLIYIHPERLIALFEVMHDCNCRMYISAYKPTVAKKETILNTLQKYGVEFFWAGPANGAPIEKFAKKKLIRPESDMNGEYRLCGADGVCHTIRDGYLYPCENVVNGFIRIQEAFDMKFEGFDDSLGKIRIDICDTALDGYELARHLNTATPACRYCSAKRQVSYEWKQVPGKRQRLEDFVIM
jgi:FkbM family methyltransferase